MYRLLTGITAIFTSLQCFACDLPGYRTTDQAAQFSCHESLTPETTIWRSVSTASQKRPFAIADTEKLSQNTESSWRHSNHSNETNSKTHDWPNYRISINTDRFTDFDNTAFNSIHRWQLSSLSLSSKHHLFTQLHFTPKNKRHNQTKYSFYQRPSNGYARTSGKRKQLSPANQYNNRIGAEKKFASATHTVALDTQFDVKTYRLFTGEKRGSSFDESFGSFDTNKRFVRNLKPVFIS